MAVQVYTFRITYLGVENRIWRTAQVSSSYDLARLGCMVLSTFDTLACHLFGMTFKGVQYYLDIEELETAPEGICCSMLCMTRLSKLKMDIGDKLLMMSSENGIRVIVFKHKLQEHPRSCRILSIRHE